VPWFEHAYIDIDVILFKSADKISGTAGRQFNVIRAEHDLATRNHSHGTAPGTGDSAEKRDITNPVGVRILQVGIAIRTAQDRVDLSMFCNLIDST
jgi:hypothetical protein